MEKVRIRASHQYDVCIGRGILGGLPGLLGESGPGGPGRGRLGSGPDGELAPPSPDPLLVVSDRAVARFYLGGVEAGLAKAGYSVRTAVFQGGERLKNERSLSSLLRIMAREGLTRDSIVLALGGGVVGDFAGFAASIFMRGCGFVQVPTTLLAQVDSSVGGKVGINLEQGKNLVGSFHHPLLVVCDTGTLATLPGREVVSGLAEVIKYGLIRDRVIFERIEETFHGWNLKGKGGRVTPASVKEAVLGDEDFLRFLIRRSVEIKGEVVGADERERSLRMVLNFGHTFGHAIEQITRYRRFLHGEAVFVGMKMAVGLSRLAGLLAPSDETRILALLDIFPIPLAGRIDAEALYAQMGRDKKMKGGAIHFVLLDGIGKAAIVPGVEKGKVIESITNTLAR